ncbi:hypothetical protein E0Z10_g1715 [Xylaria hypoxylon]|uniref:Rhodopsin domain-containing protein n=1 Tax=Xylaria hypoxylon TaxID=37992 RepID=A0A4Z0YRJ9_9PEZI|nr:hypothetical protein E0Z10_g1715 [Xylaria hypoxylon]
MSVPVDSTGSQGIGPLSLGLTYTLTGVGIIAVAARFIVKRRTAKHLGPDDWIMLLALALQIIYQAFFTVIIIWGGGLAYDRLDALQKVNVSKWGWISAIPSILVSCVARISITILLVRIFGVRRWLKWYLICFTSVLSVLSVLSIIFLAAQCNPWDGLWDRTVQAKRWNPYIYAYTALAAQFLYALSDLTFVLFPVLVISKLNMPRRRKVALGTILALSLITLGIVITKIAVVLLRLTDPLASTGTLARFYQSLTNLIACLEQWLVIIMGCIPTLKLPAHFKLPTLEDMGSWVASLVPSSWSSRSRQSSAYNSADNSSYHDLELVPKLRIHDEAKPYTVTLSGNTADPYTNTPAKKIMQRTEFSVQYD